MSGSSRRVRLVGLSRRPTHSNSRRDADTNDRRQCRRRVRRTPGDALLTGASVSFTCHGHPGIAGTHDKTLELTRDPRSRAGRRACSASQRARRPRAAALRGDVEVTLECGGMRDVHRDDDAVLPRRRQRSCSGAVRACAAARSRTTRPRARPTSTAALVQALADPAAEVRGDDPRARDAAIGAARCSSCRCRSATTTTCRRARAACSKRPMSCSPRTRAGSATSRSARVCTSTRRVRQLSRSQRGGTRRRGARAARTGRAGRAGERRGHAVVQRPGLRRREPRGRRRDSR